MKLRLILAAAIVALLSLASTGARADAICTTVTLPVVQVGTCVPLP